MNKSQLTDGQVDGRIEFLEKELAKEIKSKQRRDWFEEALSLLYVIRYERGMKRAE